MMWILKATPCFFRGLASLIALLGAAHAWAQTISISVGPDQALTYPSNMTVLPDEHTTFTPPAAGSNRYLVFAASNVGPGIAGTVVLQTTDLTNFTLASGYTSPVMSPPVRFSSCNPPYDSEFDENYTGQGSVLQDPTLPPGNLMMFYEAENHCPGGVWQQPFYATIGFARSSDNGVTWPQPVDDELGGPDRYPVLKLSAPEPASEPTPASMGDALPAAFVDKNNVYVTYVTPPGPGLTGDGRLRVARAQLEGGGQLSFLKWYNGSFSQPGIGGLDSGVLPAGGCIGYQSMGSISYVDPLGLYLMTFACGSSKAVPPHAAWYFSVATSLDLQDWTVPQMIANSQFPLFTPCPGSTAEGASFDGWYPSLMSPGSVAGHVGLTGLVFFLNGCDVTTDRKFMSRTFSITVDPGTANYQGLWWNAPAESESGWGINFAHQGDVIFATWFTYDVNGNAWWLSMTANKTAALAYSGQLIRTNGTPFNAFVPPATATVVGTGTLTFTSGTTGSFAYSVSDGANVATQTKAIVLQTFGPVPTCVWGAQSDLTKATNYQDLWWAAGGAESGWGVNLIQQGTTIFATWFTYDVNHNPLWYSVTAAQTGPNTYSGTLLRTTGPAFSAVPFNPNLVGRTTVGTVTFTFANGNAGTFEYQVDDGSNVATQTKAITRQVFRSPGTVCQ